MSTRKERSARNRRAHASERATVLAKVQVDPLDEEPMARMPALASIPWNKATLTEEARQAVASALLDGYPRNEIARALGTTVATLRRLAKDDAELRDAVEVRKDIEEAELRDLLMGMARKGDTVAAIFLAKAQFGWRDREDGKLKVEAGRAGVLVVPTTGSLEEFAADAYKQQAQFRERRPDIRVLEARR